MFTLLSHEYSFIFISRDAMNSYRAINCNLSHDKEKLESCAWRESRSVSLSRVSFTLLFALVHLSSATCRLILLVICIMDHGIAEPVRQAKYVPF